jgi:enamine deaminase RidA (YjgF/YER057c/UK114 family)
VDPKVCSAVIVNDLPLIYVSQLPAEDPITRADPKRAAKALIESLERLLADSRSSLNQVVKLNVCVDSEAIADDVSKAMLGCFPDNRAPALSLTVSPKLVEADHIALDAIAVAKAEPRQGKVRRQSILSEMPSGSRLYISGQADPSKDFPEATKKTLQSLTATLKHCGRTEADIALIKCFVPPLFSTATIVRQEASRFFGGDHIPISFVEWKSASPLIEIELVAWGGPANNDAKEPLEFITPPGMTASPVYSRVARINRGPTIFIGDIAAPSAGRAEEQLQASFDVLGKLLVKTSSDFQHLAKATYYVTDDAVSKAHNAIRPKLFDSTRPPAASKALVNVTAYPGSRYVMDMIAVPAESEKRD